MKNTAAMNENDKAVAQLAKEMTWFELDVAERGTYPAKHAYLTKRHAALVAMLETSPESFLRGGDATGKVLGALSFMLNALK